MTSICSIYASASACAQTTITYPYLVLTDTNCPLNFYRQNKTKISIKRENKNKGGKKIDRIAREAEAKQRLTKMGKWV